MPILLPMYTITINIYTSVAPRKTKTKNKSTSTFMKRDRQTYKHIRRGTSMTDDRYMTFLSFVSLHASHRSSSVVIPRSLATFSVCSCSASTSIFPGTYSIISTDGVENIASGTTTCGYDQPMDQSRDDQSPPVQSTKRSINHHPINQHGHSWLAKSQSVAQSAACKNRGDWISFFFNMASDSEKVNP